MAATFLLAYVLKAHSNNALRPAKDHRDLFRPSYLWSFLLAGNLLRMQFTRNLLAVYLDSVLVLPGLCEVIGHLHP